MSNISNLHIKPVHDVCRFVANNLLGDLMSAIPRMRYEKLLANYVATPEILFYFSALKSR